jgi:hypothetical protein
LSPVHSFRLSRPFVLAAIAVALMGCGGGGGDDAFGDVQQLVQPAGPIDTYLGTIVGRCHVADDVLDESSPYSDVYRRISITLDNKVSGTLAQGSYRHEFFYSNTCAGTPRHTITISGASNFPRIDGSVIIDGKTVHKVTIGEGVYFPGISAASIVVNGLRFAGDGYIRLAPSESKDLMWLDGDRLHFGYGEPGADGYPTVLAPRPEATLRRAS